MFSSWQSLVNEYTYLLDSVKVASLSNVCCNTGLCTNFLLLQPLKKKLPTTLTFYKQALKLQINIFSKTDTFM